MTKRDEPVRAFLMAASVFYDDTKRDYPAGGRKCQLTQLWSSGQLHVAAPRVGSTCGIGILPMIHGLEAHATLDRLPHAIALLWSSVQRTGK